MRGLKNCLTKKKLLYLQQNNGGIDYEHNQRRTQKVV